MNKIFKILIVFLFCITVNSSANAVDDGQLPVSNSYSDIIQSVKDQTSKSTQKINNEDRENTLAHRAVTESIDDTVNAAQSNDNTILSKELKKQTKPKTSFTGILFKFLFAMLWVVISSGFIFLILLAYKKLILKGRSVLPTYESMEHSLETPKNFKEAIKIFLDKTKWN